MSNSMERTALIEALDTVAPALAQNLINPISFHYWFTGKSLMACNGSFALSVPLQTEFVGAVPQTLPALLKTRNAKDVEFVPSSDGATLVVKAASARLKLATLDPSNFIFKFPKLGVNAPLELDPAKLLDAITHCIYSLGNDTGRSDRLGVSLVWSDKRLDFHSTDGATVSYAAVPVKASPFEEKSGSAILPTAFCKEFVKIAKGATEIKFEITEDYVQCIANGVRMFADLIQPDKQHQDWGKLMATNYPKEVKAALGAMPFDKNGASKLPMILTSACVITEAAVDKTKTKITCAKGIMTFLSESERGEVKDSLKVHDGHPDVEAFIDPRRLLDGVERFRRWVVTENIAAMVSEDGNKVYLVATTGS